jgi:hypothetical protein
MSKSNALVVSPEKFPVLAEGNGDFLSAIQHNLGGEEITPGDLNRIKVPAAGGTTWVLDTPDGEESCKALEGVLVHHTRRRAFWPDSNPTGDPPHCASADCTTGIGEPGGVCNDCPHNAWGSAIGIGGKEGRGKACKERRLLFLLREGQHLPDIVDAPPGSLKGLRNWLLSLAPLRFNQITTRLELVKDKNKDNIEFARVKATKTGTLPDDVQILVLRYSQELGALFGAVQVEQDAGEPVEV